MTDKVRIDKWLWGVRVFKTRTLATECCKSNKVKINGKEAKPSTEVFIGNTVEVKKDGFNMQYKVLGIVHTRVSAALAGPCYENVTPKDELNKYEAWFLAKSGSEFREKGAGRPTKRERRELDEFKDK